MTLNLSKTCLGRQAKTRTKEKTSREKETNSRRRLTDSIHLLVSYAEIHGSKGAKFYYANISKLINSCAGITNKDDITKYQKSIVETLESATIGEISKGIYKRKHYKEIYQCIKDKLNVLKEYI